MSISLVIRLCEFLRLTVQTLDKLIIKCYNADAMTGGGDRRSSRRVGLGCEGHSEKMDDHTANPRYTTGIAARLAGVPAHALRTYEREGLLVPGRLGARNRLFSDADISRARHIAELARQGINMAGIKAILKIEEEHRMAEE